MLNIFEQLFKKYVLILFFSTFFLFSHILYIFHINKEINIFGIGGYEGIKSTIIALSGLFFIIFSIFYIFKKNIEIKNSSLIIFSSIIFLLLVSSIFSINPKISFLGTFDKYHGIFFYISIIFFSLSIFFSFEKKDFYKTLYIIFFFSSILYLYTIIQKLGLDPIFEKSITDFSKDRVFSSLGNPNYLAGLSLILLPLSNFIKNKILKNIFLFSSFIIIILTKSYFGIFLAILYLIYHFTFKTKKIFFPIISIFLLIIIIGFFYISSEKIGSLNNRFYIWETSINAIFYNFKTFFFGWGADTISIIFDNFKIYELQKNNFFTASRTHNIFLDFFYFFGFLGFVIFSFFSFYIIKKANNKEIKISLLLFLIFFSFNVPVGIHFLLIGFLIAGIYKKIW